MAVDIFLKIDGVEGESKDKSHKGMIDVLAVNWGMSNSGSMTMGGGGGTGKVNIQDISISKYVDKATPNLIRACCNGKHFKEGELIVRKAAGDEPLEYFKVVMRPVMVTSVDTGGSNGEERLTENVSLDFSEMEVIYVEQKSDGIGNAEVKLTWNIEENAEG